MSVQIKRRADYMPPAFAISTVDLHITLHPTETRVLSSLRINRQGNHQEALFLDGDNLPVNKLSIDGIELPQKSDNRLLSLIISHLHTLLHKI